MDEELLEAIELFRKAEPEVKAYVVNLLKSEVPQDDSPVTCS